MLQRLWVVDVIGRTLAGPNLLLSRLDDLIHERLALQLMADLNILAVIHRLDADGIKRRLGEYTAEIALELANRESVLVLGDESVGVR